MCCCVFWILVVVGVFVVVDLSWSCWRVLLKESLVVLTCSFLLVVVSVVLSPFVFFLCPLLFLLLLLLLELLSCWFPSFFPLVIVRCADLGPLFLLLVSLLFLE